MIYPEKFIVLDMLELHPRNLWIYQHLDTIIEKIRIERLGLIKWVNRKISRIFISMGKEIIKNIFRANPLYARLKRAVDTTNGGKTIRVPLEYR